MLSLKLNWYWKNHCRKAGNDSFVSSREAVFYYTLRNDSELQKCLLILEICSILFILCLHLVPGQEVAVDNFAQLAFLTTLNSIYKHADF